jgi:pyruvate formate lyase activating enzyme
MHQALLWEKSGDRIHCLLCPHSCRIAVGKRGWCGVRENVDGTLDALTYGMVSSLAVDPIEKKPVFHYRPGTRVLSLGSVGCTMHCGHCQNWQISRPAPDDGSVALRFVSPEALVQIAEREDCPGIAFTYNEPVIWAEYVLDSSRLAKEHGLYTVMVTNGYITAEGLDLLGEVIDVWRVDVKAFSAEPFRRLCKVTHPELVREMAVRAKTRWGMHVEVVTNVVPTVNDSEEELTSIATWIEAELGPDTPWHVTRFMPYLEFSHLEATPLSTLRRAREIGRAAGLHFVYLGNVSDRGAEDTTCPDCGEVAVRRDGFSVSAGSVEQGACASCGRDLGIVGDVSRHR